MNIRTHRHKDSATWAHGRWWLHLGDRNAICVEWAIKPDASLGLTFHVDDEGATLTIDLGPLGRYYLSWQRFFRVRCYRITGIRLHTGYLWLDLWHDDDGHLFGEGWPGLHASIEFMRVLFGKPRFTKKALGTARVLIPLPEGNYEATVTFWERRWQRARLPFSKVVFTADIKPDRPFPVEGKGENSWDIGEDAIYELSTEARTPSAAVVAAVRAVLADRQRHGVPESVKWTGGFITSRDRAQA